MGGIYQDKVEDPPNLIEKQEEKMQRVIEVEIESSDGEMIAYLNSEIIKPNLNVIIEKAI